MLTLDVDTVAHPMFPQLRGVRAPLLAAVASLRKARRRGVKASAGENEDGGLD